MWIAKSSEWTINYMKLLWNQTHLVPRYSPGILQIVLKSLSCYIYIYSYTDGKIKHIFEWEQRAFHYLINSEMWEARGMPKYDGDTFHACR